MADPVQKLSCKERLAARVKCVCSPQCRVMTNAYEKAYLTLREYPLARGHYNAELRKRMSDAHKNNPKMIQWELEKKEGKTARAKKWIKANRAYHKTRRGTKRSPESIAKFSKTIRAVMSTPEFKKKRSAASKKTWASVSKSKRLIWTCNISKSLIGKECPWNKDLDKRRRSSESLKEAYAAGKRKPFTRGKVFYYRNGKLKISMRSSWEVAFAKWLDAHLIPWKYEPKYFRMTTCSYCPDFFLIKSKVWIEIKGFLTNDAKRKMKLFAKEYPSERLYMLQRKELKTLGVLEGTPYGRSSTANFG